MRAPRRSKSGLSAREGVNDMSAMRSLRSEDVPVVVSRDEPERLTVDSLLSVLHINGGVVVRPRQPDMLPANVQSQSPRGAARCGGTVAPHHRLPCLRGS